MNLGSRAPVHATTVALLTVMFLGCGSTTSDTPSTPATADARARDAEVADRAARSGAPTDGPGGIAASVTHATVAIIADTAEKGLTSRSRAIAGMIGSHTPRVDSVFIAGDCVRFDGEGSLLDFFHSYWAPATESNLAQFDGIVFPQLGNHEYFETDGQGYFDYFEARLQAIADLPTYHGSIDTVGRGWYSVDVNQWHVVSLNSNCGDIDGGCAASGIQGKWLAADLAAHAGMPTIAIWHEPIWTCTIDGHEGKDEMQPLWNMLFDAHADFVFNGHNHVYQRYRPLDKRSPAVEDPAGITEIIVGTGGSSDYQVCSSSQDPRVANALGGSSALGTLFFTFGSDGSYAWQFRLENDDSVFDSGHGRSHNAR